jgi:hypothetical protein
MPRRVQPLPRETNHEGGGLGKFGPKAIRWAGPLHG